MSQYPFPADHENRRDAVAGDLVALGDLSLGRQAVVQVRPVDGLLGREFTRLSGRGVTVDAEQCEWLVGEASDQGFLFW